MGDNDQSHLLEGLMAMRDVEEIAMILYEFPTATKEELCRLIDDAILPRIDHSTPGRDRQLELFIRSNLSPRRDGSSHGPRT